jgi:hypothetical protein
MYQMSQMIVPGSTYWNMGFGLRREEVTEDAEGMANMRQLGRAISWLGKTIQPALASYPKKGGAHE